MAESGIDAGTGLPSTFAVAGDVKVDVKKPEIVYQDPAKDSRPIRKIEKNDVIEEKKEPVPVEKIESNTSEGKLLDVLTENDIDSIQSQNTKLLDNMSAKDIEENRKLLESLLSKSNIDFLKKNKNYIESRKNEIKSKKSTDQGSQPQFKPKKKSAKESFFERHKAAMSVKLMMPDLSAEVFEEDSFEAFFYACHFDNEGHPAKGLSTQDLIESSNMFDGTKNDEYHTISDIIEMTDSTHHGHIIFGMHKIAAILSKMVDVDSDSIKSHVTGTQTTVTLSKMRTILGLIEVAKLDQRLAWGIIKKNVNIVIESLDAIRWLLRWLTSRMIAMSKCNAAILQQVIRLVMGEDKEKNQIKLAFVDEQFLVALSQLVEVEQSPELLGLMFEISYYLRFMLPLNKTISKLVQVFMAKMNGSDKVAETLMKTEKILDQQTTLPQSMILDVANIQTVFDTIAIYRSNLKNGSKLNTLSLDLLASAFTLLSAPEGGAEFAINLHSMASVAIAYLPQPPIHVYLSLSPILRYSYDRLTFPTDTLKARLMYHTVDSDHYQLVSGLVNDKDFDAHVHEIKSKGDVDSDMIADKEDRLSIRHSLLTIYSDSLPGLLSRIVPSLTAVDKMLVFANVVKLYIDDSIPASDISGLATVVLRYMDRASIRESIRRLSVHEAMIKAMIDSYNYRSFGDHAFTTTLILFATVHCKFDISK